MPTVKVFVEVIGGEKMLAEIDPGVTVEDTAGVIAQLAGKSLVDDDGKAKNWRLFAPKPEGGFGPADPTLRLIGVAGRMKRAFDAGQDVGFAGPGEFEGSKYLFKLRLFVPGAPPKPPPRPDTPVSIADEEAIDLTDLSNVDDFETETQRRKKKRRKSIDGESSTVRRKRKKDPDGSITGRRRKKKDPDGSTIRRRKKKIDPSGTQPAPTKKQPAATEMAEQTPAKAAVEAPTEQPVDEASDRQPARDRILEIPALTGAGPEPGDAALTSSPQTPGPAVDSDSPAEAASPDGPEPPTEEDGPEAPPESSSAEPVREPRDRPVLAEQTLAPSSKKSASRPESASRRTASADASSRRIKRPDSSTSKRPKEGPSSKTSPAPEKKSGGKGLIIGVVVLVIAAGAAFALTRGGSEPAPVVDEPPVVEAPVSEPTSLSDRVSLKPYETGEGVADDAVHSAVAAWGGLGVASPNALRAHSSSVAPLVATLSESCRSASRFDACDAWAWIAFSTYRACADEQCDPGGALPASRDAIGHAYGNAQKLSGDAQAAATKRLLTQAVRIGGADFEALRSSSAPMAALAQKGCAMLGDIPECAAIPAR